MRARCDHNPSAVSMQGWMLGGDRGKETVGRSEVLVTTFLVEWAGHRQSSRLCFSNEWFPWMGIKKSTWEDNDVDACDAQALPHIHSTELLAHAAESQKWQVNCNSSIPLWIPSGICWALYKLPPPARPAPSPFGGAQSHCAHLAKPGAAPRSLLLQRAALMFAFVVIGLYLISAHTEW